MTKGWRVAALAVLVGVLTYGSLKLLFGHRSDGVQLQGLVSAESVFGAKLQLPADLASSAPPAPLARPTAAEPAPPAATKEPAPAKGEIRAAPDSIHAAVRKVPARVVSADRGERTSRATSDAAPHQAAPVTRTDVHAAAPATATVSTKPPKPPKPPASFAVAPAATPHAGSAARIAPGPAAGRPVTTLGAWWAAVGSADGLRVIYVGSAAFRPAIVVMANAPFASASTVNATVLVRDDAGRPVAGIWELGPSNKAMLIFPVERGGGYRISIGSALSDAAGRRLGQTVAGSVLIP